jgi:hypothetical protein
MCFARIFRVESRKSLEETSRRRAFVLLEHEAERGVSREFSEWSPAKSPEEDSRR